MTGQADGKTFTYLQTKSSVTFVIGGVTMDGIKVDASYSTTYEVRALASPPPPPPRRCT